MKNKLLRYIKVIVSSVVAISIVAIGIWGSSVGADASTATETTSDVQYVEYGDDFAYATYLDNNEAPEYTGVDTDGVGYLFGGWYDKVDNTYTAIEDTADLAAKTGTVVAKFVPAQTLSVKCQNWAGTNADSASVLVRIISAVDSTNYSSYGFIISKIVNGAETTLGVYTADQVYSKFNYYKNADDTAPAESYVPSDLFGSDAEHFISCTVGYIPKADHGTIICIKPFWVTLDGTEVYGLSKYAHVEDGYLGYVNVPVNLNILSEDNKAAAGILNVKCESEGLTFIGVKEGVEYGKVFDEMEVYAAEDGTIRCVGNTSDISNNTEKDIYINLKFQRTNTTDIPEKGVFYKFSVTDEEFCDSDENLIPSEEADVWNIKY